MNQLYQNIKDIGSFVWYIMKNPRSYLILAPVLFSACSQDIHRGEEVDLNGDKYPDRIWADQYIDVNTPAKTNLTEFGSYISLDKKHFLTNSICKLSDVKKWTLKNIDGDNDLDLVIEIRRPPGPFVPSSLEHVFLNDGEGNFTKK